MFLGERFIFSHSEGVHLSQQLYNIENITAPISKSMLFGYTGKITI